MGVYAPLWKVKTAHGIRKCISRCTIFHITSIRKWVTPSILQKKLVWKCIFVTTYINIPSYGVLIKYATNIPLPRIHQSSSHLHSSFPKVFVNPSFITSPFNSTRLWIFTLNIQAIEVLNINYTFCKFFGPSFFHIDLYACIKKYEH